MAWPLGGEVVKMEVVEEVKMGVEKEEQTWAWPRGGRSSRPPAGATDSSFSSSAWGRRG